MAPRALEPGGSSPRPLDELQALPVRLTSVHHLVVSIACTPTDLRAHADKQQQLREEEDAVLAILTRARARGVPCGKVREYALTEVDDNVLATAFERLHAFELALYPGEALAFHQPGPDRCPAPAQKALRPWRSPPRANKGWRRLGRV